MNTFPQAGWLGSAIGRNFRSLTAKSAIPTIPAQHKHAVAVGALCALAWLALAFVGVDWATAAVGALVVIGGLCVLLITPVDEG